tara:strand:+ start:15 stop:128 length:114 start_codon:yes stop_codon:yes gene_type:complete
MKTAILTTDTFLNHDTGQVHPERADMVDKMDMLNGSN